MKHGSALPRLAWVAVAVNWHSRVKVTLLTLLIAIGVLVFLMVAELSRASSDSLSDAIDSDLGVMGTYRIEPSPGLGLSRHQLIETVGRAVGGLASRPMSVPITSML